VKHRCHGGGGAVGADPRVLPGLSRGHRGDRDSPRPRTYFPSPTPPTKSSCRRRRWTALSINSSVPSADRGPSPRTPSTNCVALSPPWKPAWSWPWPVPTGLRPDDARTRGEGGAGLGLAITRDIATAHGGTSNAKPPRRTDRGARMVLTLPVDTGCQPGSSSSPCDWGRSALPGGRGWPRPAAGKGRRYPPGVSRIDRGGVVYLSPRIEW